MGSNTSRCFNGASTAQEKNKGLPIATHTGIYSNPVSPQITKTMPAISRRGSDPRTTGLCPKAQRSPLLGEPSQNRQPDGSSGISSPSRPTSKLKTSNSFNSNSSNKGKFSINFYDIASSSSGATSTSSFPLRRSASLGQSSSESFLRRTKGQGNSGRLIDFVNHEISAAPEHVRTRKGRCHGNPRMETGPRRYSRISSNLHMMVSRDESSDGLVRSRSMIREPRHENGIRLPDSLDRVSSTRSRDGRSRVSERLLAFSSEIAENRDHFLEERRLRAQSQVRALRRLSSNFGTLSTHERSCSLSSEDHSAMCSCRGNRRSSQTKYAASISRIIMLAEALFEVLDELHNHNLGLSSQSSSVPVGSLPAPDNIVKSLPIRVFQEHRSIGDAEVAQCYICLMEYEEGDLVKLLPCQHEFHVSCIDKWLKEVHRVCPLCRGNVCSDEFSI